jgi:opacity protein-like surface antigen
MRNAAAVALLSLLASAQAAAADGSKFYFGFDFGQATADLDQRQLDNSVVESFNSVGIGVLNGSSDVSEDAFTWGITLGYQPLRYLAFEASYFDFGSAEYKAKATLTDGVTTTDGSVDLDASTQGPVLSALGILPFADTWSVYARAGVLFADTKYDAHVSGAGVTGSVKDSDNSTEFLWGVGMGYTAGQWTTRIEYQQAVDVGSSDTAGEMNIDRITIGAIYHF